MLRLAFAACLLATPALADFKICNNSGYGASVAIGYKDGDTWVSEGWWNSDSGDCVTPVSGALKNRYYYLRVESDDVDYPEGGYAFCVTPEAFTIRGDENCDARGFTKAFFGEVDTGDAREWVFTLDPAQTGAPGGSASAGGGKKSSGGGSSPEMVTQDELEREYERLYALVYEDLQGVWVSPDDAGMGIIIDDHRLEDFFEGRIVPGAATWSLADGCAGGDGGPVLIVTYDQFPNDPLCWVLERLSYRELVFDAVNGKRISLLKKEQ
jgi:uncharacterized membrane protein